ncbi:MAG: pyridoxamine 5'-phosphate oxidase family protein, partial [Chloroflexota bacterium]|nr:pyridoxamine 5'-phosphate oxidase family protein [Chloroflexota bacterium]
MIDIRLPTEVEKVFNEFLTCELTTFARDGTPITWPILPIYRPQPFQFLILTPIGLPQKAFHIQRNPHVSLLFSDPTGSGLVNPPAVLVQGDAEVPDEILTARETADEGL